MTPVPGAWSHRLYRLETSRGVYAVKQMMDPWHDPGWRTWLAEAAAFELAAFDAGVSMPRPVPAADGHCLADVESANGAAEVPVRVHEWVDGRPCPARPVERSVAERLGSDLATMHSLRFEPTRRDVFPRATRDSVAGWPELVDRLLAVDAGIAEAADAVSGWVVRIGELFDAADTDFGDEPMSHGDVDQKNVLLGRDGPFLCDWDVAAPWQPRAEVARTAMSLACWERAEVARRTIAAYTATRGDDDVLPVEPRDLAVELVVGLDWVVFCLERATGLRPADEQRRAESRRLVPGLLAALPRDVDLALNVDRWIAG